MTQIDDILYSPISLPLYWDHLWDDLDNTNKRILKGVLGNLRTRYNCYRALYPDPGVVNFTAELTAYVLPKLIAHHIISVQPMAAVRSMIVRLEYEHCGTRDQHLTIKSHVLNANRRNLSSRILPDDRDYAKYLTQIGDEIICELDQDILRIVRTLPDPPTARNTFDVSTPIPTTHPVTVSEEFATLIVMMHRESAYIANRSKRGRGNRAIVSPAALTILNTGEGDGFFKNSGSYNAPVLPSQVRYCGRLGNSIEVFVDPHADDETPILISYNGDSTIDGGIVWAPHVVIDPVNQIVDPNTFGLIQPFQTSRGYLERVAVDESDAISASRNYFGIVGFNTTAMTFL